MNVIDYINEYGQIGFEDKTFNEVDKLILANLSYVNFQNIVSNNDKEKKRLQDVEKEFIENKYHLDKNIMAIKGGIKLLRLMAKANRYKDLLLYNYERIISEEEQFGAVTIEINKDLVYVSFEGTADEMVGWEEDFKMCYEFPVKSQRHAVKYLNKHFTFKSVELILGGHSKGGNLALVGGMYCNFLVRRKIKDIYSYDGPGLLKKFLKKRKYKRIDKRYKHVVPNNSMIGMMLYTKDDYVIKTKSVGIVSHFAFYWQVDENSLIKDTLNKSSIELHQRIIKWIEKYDDKQKKKFVKEMFDVFKKNQVYTVLDFMKRPSVFVKILSDSNKVSKQTSIMFKEFTVMVRKYMFKTFREKIVK